MKNKQSNINFWLKLKKPILALAPMAGITDSAFRQMCKAFGADIVYSEMISVAGLVYNSRRTLELMEFDKSERPFVVQLFGSKPEHFAAAVRKIIPPSPFIKGEIDGIDINFGCPVKKVAKQGAGAVLMNDLKLARRIVKAVLSNTDLPVSIKCRSQVGSVTVLDFLKKIKDLPVAAIMIHGRSLAQGHSGEVDWKIIRDARKYFSGVILANGGVKDKAGADELLRLTGTDGVGIGQGALGRPWIFEDVKSPQPPLSRGSNEIFKIMLKHAELAEKLSAQGGSASGGKGRQGIIEMRKHLCWYVGGLKNASELRKALVRVESLEEIKKIFE